MSILEHIAGVKNTVASGARIDELPGERGRTFHRPAEGTGVSRTALRAPKQGKARGINFGTPEAIRPARRRLRKDKA